MREGRNVTDYYDDQAAAEQKNRTGRGFAAFGSKTLHRTAPSAEYHLEACAECNGKGHESENRGFYGETDIRVYDCAFCAGQGRVWVKS
jgi:hypothetical protein